MTEKVSNNKLLAFLILSMFFFLPFERIPTFEFNGFTIKISYILLLIVLFVVLVQKPWSLFLKNKLMASDCFLISFWLAGLISLLYSPDIKRSGVIMGLWLLVFLAYLLLSRIINTDYFNKKIIIVILASTALVCLFGLFQFVGDSYNLPVGITGLRIQYTKAILGFPRIQSVALEPLYFANFLFVPLFLSLRQYIEKQKLFGGYFWLSSLVLINIILTISRGAYIALGVTFAIFLIYLLYNNKNGIYLKNLIGILLITAFSILFSLGMIDKLNGKNARSNFLEHSAVNAENVQYDGSANDRLVMYKQSFKFFKEKPIFGNGTGSFGVLVGPDSKVEGYQIVNNEYLEILSENGIVGLLLFIGFTLFFLIETFSGFKKLSEPKKITILTLFLGSMAIFIQYNFFSTLYILYVWVFLALLRSYVLNENFKKS